MRVPRGTLSCVPAVFSLPQGSQVALQGDTGVCVCVHTETVCFLYLSCVPTVFSLPHGSQVALQEDTGVCVCVHTETVCFVYLQCKQAEIGEGHLQFHLHTCVCM